ncbi:MAG: helix-turn-helix transcriptional regulator [Muribaculaceae bacterium]|nr:helix-turn-helix transcriptional regulator [Muribaculaceae bacterium]
MKGKTIQFLEAHTSDKPSQFEADAQWRKENENWLRWSRQLATALIGYMQDNKIKRAELAQRLDVSPQYVSRLLSGKENLSFKSIAHIEERLGLKCMSLLAI